METNDQPTKRLMRGAMDTGCGMWAPIISPLSDALSIETSAVATLVDSHEASSPEEHNLKALKNI